MEAKELRIGNIVLEKYSGEMIVSAIIDKVLHLRKTVLLPEGSYSTAHINGVRLTRNWIDRMGFTQEDEFSICKLELGYCRFMFNAHHQVCLAVDHWKEAINYRCEYVHQLQNLYFALTQEELTIS